jgi:hypothetical protein
MDFFQKKWQRLMKVHSISVSKTEMSIKEQAFGSFKFYSS